MKGDMLRLYRQMQFVRSHMIAMNDCPHCAPQVARLPLLVPVVNFAVAVRITMQMLFGEKRLERIKYNTHSVYMTTLSR